MDTWAPETKTRITMQPFLIGVSFRKLYKNGLLYPGYTSISSADISIFLYT
jgi:hypothetical protein